MILLLLFDPMWWKSGISWIMNVGVRFEYVQCSLLNIHNIELLSSGFEASGIKSTCQWSNSDSWSKLSNQIIIVFHWRAKKKKYDSIDLIWFDLIPNQMGYNVVTCANNSISMFAMFAIVFNLLEVLETCFNIWHAQNLDYDVFSLQFFCGCHAMSLKTTCAIWYFPIHLEYFSVELIESKWSSSSFIILFIISMKENLF